MYQDWEQEYHHSGMRTFLAVPIIANSNEPMLGVLTLSSCQPGAFWESWCVKQAAVTVAVAVVVL